MPRVLILPVHSDGRPCAHRPGLSRPGATPAGPCADRAGFTAFCSAAGCDWTAHHPMKVIVRDRRDEHLAWHDGATGR